MLKKRRTELRNSVAVSSISSLKNKKKGKDVERLPFQIIQRSDKQLHAKRRATYVNSYMQRRSPSSEAQSVKYLLYKN